MKLREHDKQALQIIASNKSVGGRYYDFEAFLSNFSNWSMTGIMPTTWAKPNKTVLTSYFYFLEPESVLMTIDNIIANLKSDNKNLLKYYAFEFYFLIPVDSAQERAEKEKLLRAKLRYKKGRFLSAYTKAREEFQELIRVNLLKFLSK